ncbi:MAG: wax ester/triacylglycerol synthase family O-acyltransferase [Burkholderiales bacterium]
MDHLSSVDASFLHLETPETPMHVGSLMLFELPKGYKGDYFEDVKAMIANRYHLCSIFHRKLAQMPFELTDPVWIEDDDVELDYHVRSVTLRKPGSMAQLEHLIARLHATLLDRSRPLWEVYVIEGLGNGQVAYYTKAHHSGIDGKAGVELAKVFYDMSPATREVKPPRAARGSGNYQLGVAELLQAAVSNTAKQYVKAAKMLPKAVKALGAGAKIVASRRTAPGERSLRLGIAPKTIFNASITNQRSYATMSLPLGEMKALGKRVGGTVNTVVMAMCASALRQFLLERELLPPKSLIASVPVSLRSADDSSMNNQVSMIRVDLATDLADPAERFKAIHASSEDAKSVVSTLKPVLGTDLPITGSPWLMTGLASLFGRSGLASRLPAMGNVTISNVPGLAVELYMAGARMLHFYPVSIPYHAAALNITVQSYAGAMEFGITACRRVLSQAEAHELIDLLKVGLSEIQALDPVPPAEVVEAAEVAASAAKPPARAKAKPRAPVAVVRKPGTRQRTARA